MPYGRRNDGALELQYCIGIASADRKCFDTIPLQQRVFQGSQQQYASVNTLRAVRNSQVCSNVAHLTDGDGRASG